MEANSFKTVHVGEGPPVVGDLVERDWVTPVPRWEHPTVHFERPNPHPLCFVGLMGLPCLNRRHGRLAHRHEAGGAGLGRLHLRYRATIDDTLQTFVVAQPSGAIRFDHVSTRRAGQRQFVDMHLHMPAHWTLGRAAQLRGEVERALMAAVPGLRATIELLPTDVEAHIDDPTDPVA